MGDLGKVKFTQAHGELLALAEDSETLSENSSLRELLVKLSLEPTTVSIPLTSRHLDGSQVLVLGAPRAELDQEEVETIQHFTEAGGGLLLITDSVTMINPVNSLDYLAKMAGLQLREYLNYPPTWLQLFYPHYITASVDRVRVEGVASIDCSNGAYNLARTRATQSTIIACATLGRGRVVAVGDVDLFSGDLLDLKGNKILVTNIFRWLTFQNTIDVQSVAVPETVKWGHSETVVLRLHNAHSETRPQAECVLESDVDALISKPARKTRSIPPGKTTQMQWTVTPQVLGDQELRLSIYMDGQLLLDFDPLLPRMRCEAPGYLTLQTKDLDDEPETKFQTGDTFSVEGVVHWPAGIQPPPYEFELEHSEGLIDQGYQPGEGIERWILKAVAPGEHTLTLKLLRPVSLRENVEASQPHRETGQSLSALILVRHSVPDQLTEVRAAYVLPLDAEIAARLRTVDPRLSDEMIRGQPFQVLPPEEYAKKVYDTKAALWLKQVLDAARREQWYNLDLLNEVLTYFAPAYLPGRGSFIPYDPALASHLARLHPTAKWRLEYNFLRSQESEDASIKQNVAAFLLHEKYGHGFFYTHTRLGQQLATLERHGFPEKVGDEQYKGYAKAVRLAKDSAVIVNEGFAAWMELTFLGKLDREVRQAVYPRRILLLQEATGLYERQRDSDFFQKFLPRFDSRYREGFEYLDFISRHFNPHCAIRIFLIATNIELGVLGDDDGRIQFELEAAEMKRRLLEAEEDDARSHLRLRQIAELAYKHRKAMQARIQKRHCPEDCEDYCPLEKLIEGELKWRRSYERR